MAEIKNLKEMSKRMRLNSIDMAYNAGALGAHLGGGLSCIEIFAALFGRTAKLVGDHSEIDRIIVGKAHCVLAYYSALVEVGSLKIDDLKQFEKNGSQLAGHPKRNIDIGIDFSGGSLGMAAPVAVGMAISIKKHNRNNKVFLVLGDGECEEGTIWESLMIASH